MSISPQSLARTRDKRSLRIPRKFEDFSLVTSGEIPPEAAQSNYKNFAEALKMKSKATKRHTASGDSTPEPVAKKLSGSNAAASDESPESNVKLEIATPGRRGPPRQRATPPTSGESTKGSSSKSSPVPTPIPTGEELDLECKETPPANIDFSKKPANQENFQDLPSPIPTVVGEGIQTNLTELVPSARGDIMMQLMDMQTYKSHDIDAEKSIENLDSDLIIDQNAAVPKSSGKQQSKRTEVNIKKSPFYPSITISNGCRIGSGSITKPLSDKKAPSGPPVSAPTNNSRYTARKKPSKGGQSLMAKPNGQQQQPINSNDRVACQQPKYSFSNVNPITQYPLGTRLLMNEPIYIPKSVPSIAPITVTLQQIANQARRPPFLSKKAAACLAYQDDRKFDYIISTTRALIKIAKYCEAQDLFNLRLVNKTWKSITDAGEVWHEVFLRNVKIDHCTKLSLELKAKNTKKVTIYGSYFEKDGGADDVNNMFRMNNYLTLEKNPEEIECYRILTDTPTQNRLVLEILSSIYHGGALWLTDSPACLKTTKVTWDVKVLVDDCGIASVPIQCRRHIFGNQTFYCHEKFPDLLIGAKEEEGEKGEKDVEKITLVDLDDLRDLFDLEKPQQCTDDEIPRFSITIKPI